MAPIRLRDLAIGGLVHDIGKLSVPDEILQKPGPLDDEEFEVIRRHPEWGHDLSQELGGFPGAGGAAGAGPSRAPRRRRLPPRPRRAGARPRDADPGRLRRLRRPALHARLPRGMEPGARAGAAPQRVRLVVRPRVRRGAASGSSAARSSRLRRPPSPDPDASGTRRSSGSDRQGRAAHPCPQPPRARSTTCSAARSATWGWAACWWCPFGRRPAAGRGGGGRPRRASCRPSGSPSRSPRWRPTCRPALVELGLWVAREYCSTPARGLALVLPPGTGTGAGAAAAAPALAAGRADHPAGERRRWPSAWDRASGPRSTRSPTGRSRVTRAGAAHGLRPLHAAQPRAARARAARQRRPRAAAAGDRGVGAAAPARELTAGAGARPSTRSSPASTRPEEPAPLLLHGVTGSGKTEVYLRAVAAALERGRSAIVLVPGDRADARRPPAASWSASATRSRSCTRSSPRASATTSGGACAAARRACASARARRCSRRSTTSG